MTTKHAYLLGGSGLNAVGARQELTVAPIDGEPSRDVIYNSGDLLSGVLRTISRLSSPTAMNTTRITITMQYKYTRQFERIFVDRILPYLNIKLCSYASQCTHTHTHIHTHCKAAEYNNLISNCNFHSISFSR